MNLLEHYILEVLEEKVSESFPNLVTVRVLTDCWGNMSITTHSTTRTAWEEEKKKGYFMA